MTASPAQLEALAEAALQHGTEAAAERALDIWLQANPASPRIMQWRALLLRALDQRGEAIGLLGKAAELDPQDRGIAHSLAQITHEAGRPAAGLFEQALRLDPASTAVRRGLIAARYGEGDGPAALNDLAAALRANPGWYDGHRQFAQLATLLGHSERQLETLRDAMQRFPDAGDPVFVAAELLLTSADHAGVLALVEPVLHRLRDDPALLLLKAAALDGLGQLAQSREVFEGLGPAQDIAQAEHRIHHFLRCGDFGPALREAEPWLASDFAPVVWPYVALAWRVLGDQHAEWLEEQDGLIRTVDFDPQAEDFAALTARLQSLHRGSGRFLDQSVRLGTQTDGALFARLEPEFVAVRRLVSAAMAEHVSALPKVDERHPQLALRRDQTPRFSGSWSVRLDGKGHHAPHHHPLGWFSGVLYVTVPQGLQQNQGQLALGSPPPELGLDLAPRCHIAPKPGRLVIFPSTLWHATELFNEGERLTISFDLARPLERT